MPVLAMPLIVCSHAEHSRTWNLALSTGIFMLVLLFPFMYALLLDHFILESEVFTHF